MIASRMTQDRIAPWGATDPLLYDLLVDGAITHRQLWRHHGLRIGELPVGFHSTERKVGESKHSRKVETIKFVTLSERDASLTGAELRHLAIAAEARQALTTPGARWKTPFIVDDGYWYGNDGNVPDAVYEPGNQAWAVEVSVGSYSNKRILEKATAFEERFDGQLWVCPTQRQAAGIKRLLAGHNNVRVMAANPFVAGKPPPRSGWWRNRKS